MPFGKQVRKPMFRQFGLLGLIAAATLMASPSFTFATDRYWSVNSSDWSTASNWAEPRRTSSDDANIVNGGTLTISQSSGSCRYLYLGGSDTGTVQMTGGQLRL